MGASVLQKYLPVNTAAKELLNSRIFGYNTFCLFRKENNGIFTILSAEAPKTCWPDKGARLPALPLKGFKESMSLPSHVFPYIFS